jgi:sulfite oxidase
MTTTKSERLHFYDEGLNAGTLPQVRPDKLITPVSEFFRRNHAPAPTVDLANWRLELNGLVRKPLSLSYDELVSSFTHHELTATLVCAGLRRAEFLLLGSLRDELPWQADAVSTGVWRGVWLRDVLEVAGVTDQAGYIEFIGLDQVTRKGETFGYGASIALDKAQSGDVLLATHLNGERLPAVYGFPLRAVVPGWIGARSVKWLSEVNLRAEPSDNYFQTEAYRIARTENPDDSRDVRSGEAMTEVPLNAVIVEPAAETPLKAGPVQVRGWAIGSGGRPVTKVEVAIEGPRVWTQATITATAGTYSWCFWEATIALDAGSHVLMARASDELGIMPESLEDTWNIKTYGNNAWYRVEVKVR